MTGYTPLFSSLTRGTLCGKWPDIGLWPILLSMADWRGEIDATQQYISSVTGLPLAEVTSCIDRFCQPDPESRSQAAEGARLRLIDPNKNWGWVVVNIQKYRDKASGNAQVADGRNAAKVQRYKERHRTPMDTGGHPETPTHTQTHTNTKNSESEHPVDNSTNPKNAINIAASERSRTETLRTRVATAVKRVPTNG